MIQNNKHIPFESSKANMDRFYKLTKWLPEYNLEKAIPEIINFEKRKKKELIKKSDVIILAVPHKSYMGIKIPKNKIVIDTWGMTKRIC